MMNEPAIKHQIREILQEMAPIRGEHLTDSSRLAIDLGFDSLALMEALVAIEHQFHLPECDDSALGAIETVSDVERLILDNMASGGIAQQQHAPRVHIGAEL